MKEQRLIYIDILRLIACFLVVLTHSALPSADGTDGLVKGSLSFLGSPSSELFLALSGAVLLPVHKPMKEFYHKRFLKLLPPVIFWSAITLFIYACFGKITFTSIIFSLTMVPFQPVIGVYWFIYVMIGLYLLAPIISPWLMSATKRQVQFFLFLWFINLILPYINLITPGFINQGNSHYWMLNSFGGFIGYFVLGYYLRRHRITIGINKGWIGTLMGVGSYILLLITLKMRGYSIIPLTDNLQIGSAFMVIFLMTIAQHLSEFNWIQKKAKLFSSLAKYSFGIYLIHIVVVREFVWLIFKDNRMPAIPETLLITILSLIICYGILVILSYLPKSKYIIGC